MWKKDVGVYGWTLQRFGCRKQSISTFPTGQTEPSLFLSLKLRLAGYIAELAWSGKLGRPGSEEACRRGSGLSMGLQKVHYVFVGGSFCHCQRCLTILISEAGVTAPRL